MLQSDDDDRESANSQERGLTRPLLALLLGYVKISALSQVLETDFPDSEEGAPFLDAYFPDRLRESFAEFFIEHPLRREIIATAAVNHLVNHAGVDFFARLMKSKSGEAGIGEVLKTYLTCSQKAGAASLRRDIHARGRAADETQQALLELERVLESATQDALNGGGDDPAVAVADLRKSIGL